MRVLQCLTTAEIGGTELGVLDLAEGLGAAGVEVHVCVFYPPGPLTPRFAGLGIPVVHLGRARRVTPLAAWRFVRLLRTGRYEVIHLYGARANLVGRLAAGFVGGPRVVAALRSLYPADRALRALVRLDRATLRWVDAYLSNSRTAIEFLVGQGFPRERFRWVPTGIPVERFGRPVDRRAVLKRVGVPAAGPPVVVSVANLRPMKGHELLIEALARLRRDGLEARGLFVGDGPLRADLEARVRRAGIADRVVFAGSRPDVPDLLAAADVFALASAWEGLPRSILEAMASGLPVVATAVGGVGELVAEGETGYLVAPGDAAGLAGRLAALLRDPARRRELGARARARVREGFSTERMVAGTLAVYREVVDRRPRGVAVGPAGERRPAGGLTPAAGARPAPGPGASSAPGRR